MVIKTYYPLSVSQNTHSALKGTTYYNVVMASDVRYFWRG